MQRADWLRYGTNAAQSPAVTADLVERVCKGEFPWRNGDLGSVDSSTPNGSTPNGRAAAQRYYARQHRRLTARLQRAKEEAVLVPKEVIRLRNWLEYKGRYLATRISELKSEAGSSSDPPTRLFLEGKVKMLEVKARKYLRWLRYVSKSKHLNPLLPGIPELEGGAEEVDMAVESVVDVEEDILMYDSEDESDVEDDEEYF